MKTRNLLFIFTDQQRHDTLSVSGNRTIQVPNLDALADESCVFRDAYASQPVCSPSRGTMMTGLYPHTHRVVENNLILPHDARCIAEYLHEHRTAYLGKWHLGNETRCQHGFHEWVSTEHYYYRDVRDDTTTPEENCSYHRFLVENGFMPDGEDGDYRFFTRDFATRLPVEYSKPAFLAGEADRFLRENRDRPFALYVNFLEPHPPYRSVNDDLYDPATIDLPPNFGVELDETAPAKCRFKAAYARANGRHFPLSDEHSWRKQIARYLGCVTLIDTYVGRILDSLRQHGLEDNTMVVFTSDHGEMMGDFGLISKAVMFQPSIRVPLLFRVPWVTTEQRVIDGPVNLVDLVPTILDVLGYPLDSTLQGESLYPVITADRPFGGKDVFVEYHENPDALFRKKKYAGVLTPGLRKELERLYPHPVEERTIVTPDGWRLTLNQTGEHELYDLTGDPLERTNLYGRSRYQATVSELRSKVASWQQRTGDTAVFAD